MQAQQFIWKGVKCRETNIPFSCYVIKFKIQITQTIICYATLAEKKLKQIITVKNYEHKLTISSLLGFCFSRRLERLSEGCLEGC
jgi:hypothetical protein